MKKQIFFLPASANGFELQQSRELPASNSTTVVGAAKSAASFWPAILLALPVLWLQPSCASATTNAMVGLANSDFEIGGAVSTGKARSSCIGSEWDNPQTRPATGWPLVRYASSVADPLPGLSFVLGSTDRAHSGNRSLAGYCVRQCAGVSTSQATLIGQSDVNVGVSGIPGAGVLYRASMWFYSENQLVVSGYVGTADDNSTNGPHFANFAGGPNNTWIEAGEGGHDDGDGLVSVWFGFAAGFGTSGTAAIWLDDARVTYNAVIGTDGPTVSGITADRATITWSTDEAADTIVEYGPTQAYGSVATNGAPFATHSVVLTGLAPNSTYHFRVTSRKAYYARYQSDDLTFTTGPAASDTSLAIARLGNAVELSWLATSDIWTLQDTLDLASGPSAWRDRREPVQTAGASNYLFLSLTDDQRFFRLLLDKVRRRYLPPKFTTSIGDPHGCGCTSPENPNSLAAGGSAQDNGGGAVLLHTGELTQDAVDLEIPGRGFNWRFERRYRSGMNYDGPMGQGWDFNYNRRLAVQTNGDVLCVNGLGRADRYTLNMNGTFESPSGFYTRLTRNPNGTFKERDRHGMTNSYAAPNSLGIAKLTAISDRNGNQMTLQYNAAGQLTNVIDTLDRPIRYNYDTNGHLTSVTDFTDRTLQFGYDASGNLVTATSPAVTGTTNGNNFPSGKTTRYAYSSGYADSRFNHNLLTVTAPNEATSIGPPRLVAQYDTSALSPHADRLLSLFLGGTNGTGVPAGGAIRYGYTDLGPVSQTDFNTAVFQITVTNRNGNRAEYRFNPHGNVVSIQQSTRGLRAGEPASFQTLMQYNKDGELLRRTNAELDSVEYVFNAASPDRFQQGNLLEVRRHAGPRGGDQASIVTRTLYETNFNFAVTNIDARGNATVHRYDSRGNRTNTVHRLTSIIEDFAYNEFGQMTNHTLPDNGSGHRRRDVMTYYDAVPKRGYLRQHIVDAGPTNFNLTTTYDYDAMGNVTRMVDPRGHDTLYTVNALNQIVRELSREVTDGSGIRYEKLTWYDANGGIVRMDIENRDKQGVLNPTNTHFTTLYEYDLLNHIMRTVQEKGSANLANSVVSYSGIPTALRTQFLTMEYRYDANLNRTLTRFGEATADNDPFNTVQSVFDERDLLFRETRAPGSAIQSTAQYDYDRNGNRTRVQQGTESAPRINGSTYDGFDRLIRTLDPMGNTRTNHYDANNNPISERTDGQLTDVVGSSGSVRLAEVLYTYDAMDRLTTTDTAFFDTTAGTNIGGGHSITRTAYSANSQVVTNYDAITNVALTLYDTANRLLTATDAKSNTVTHAYDSNSNIRQTTEVDRSDVAGQTNETFVTQYTYDNLDRRIQTVDNVLNTNRWAYDSRDNLAVSINRRGNRVLYQYDSRNRQVQTVRLLTDTGDGSGTETGGITNRQTWDDSSRLRSQTDGNSNTTQYVYDSLNRLITTIYADGTTTTNAYDVHDNLVNRLDANGTVVATTFDLLNRPTTNNVTPAPGVLGTTFEHYRYDGLSRNVRAENDDTLVINGYDSLSHLIREAQIVPGVISNTVIKTYDGMGNLTRLVYPCGTNIVQTFDALNRLKTSRSDPPGPGATNATYQYIGRRRVARRDSGNGTRMDVAYHGARRAWRIRHSASGVPFYDGRFAWDPQHNCIASSNLSLGTKRLYEYDSVDRLVVSGDPTIYSLDAVGNRTYVNQGCGVGSYSVNQMNEYTIAADSQRYYDGNGNLVQIQSSGSSFTYDFRNRLVMSVGSFGQTTYNYDCFNRRVEKQGNGGDLRFIFAGRDEIEEQDLTGTPVATYVRGGELLRMNRNGQSYFYHRDYLGSPVSITDDTGNVVESYAYDDYGCPESGFSSSIGNPYLFTGRRYDAETGWYLSGDRYLDAVAGRFITRDPIGRWGASFNLGNTYAYAGNNPVSRDPIPITSCGSTSQADNMCCNPAHEEGPPVPTTQTRCQGTVWSNAAQGQCNISQTEATCSMGRTTVVEIHKYLLEWIDGACVRKPVGESQRVTVPNCGGTNCE